MHTGSETQCSFLIFIDRKVTFQTLFRHMNSHEGQLSAVTGMVLEAWDKGHPERWCPMLKGGVPLSQPPRGLMLARWYSCTGLAGALWNVQ